MKKNLLFVIILLISLGNFVMAQSDNLVVSYSNNVAIFNPEELNFSSNCDDISIFPYIETFDSYGSGYYVNYPTCWTRVSTFGSGFYSPYIDFDPTFSSSVGALHLYCDDNTYTIAAINAIDSNFNVNQLKLNFKINSYNISSVLKVGVMTDPMDRNSFVQVGQEISINSDSGWEDQEVMFSSYSGSGAYIAFLIEASAGDFTIINIDNVVLDLLSPCDVYGFVAEVVSTTSFSATWDTYMDDGSGYILSYAVNPITLPFNPANGVQVPILSGATLPHVVSGLNTGDTIWVSVKAACATNWTIAQSVVLPSQISTIPYSCNFENITQNQTWTLYNGTQTNKWYIGAPGAHGSSGNGLYVSSNNGATASYNFDSASVVMASTLIQFNGASEFALSFNWKAKGEEFRDYMIAYLVPLSYNVVPGTILPEAYRITPKLSSVSLWQSKNVVLGSQYSNTVKRLLFLWRNDSSGGYTPPGLVDNIIINSLSCASPSNLVYAAVTETSAVLTWDNAPLGAEFLIEYKLASASTWNLISTQSNTYTLTSLTPSSIYNARIKAVCDPGDTSSTSNMVDFNTLCVASIPPTTIEPFTTLLPNFCWSRKVGSLPAAGNATLTNASDGWRTSSSFGQPTAAVELYSSDKYWLITPSIDLGDGTIPYQLNFDLAVTSWYGTNVSNISQSPNARFVVLISTDDGTTWNSTYILKEWNNTTGTPFTTLDSSLQSQTIPIFDPVSLLPYSGIVKFAFFATDSIINSQFDNYIHLDNFQVAAFYLCVAPTQLNVTANTVNSASIDWTEIGSSTSWNIEYGTEGFTQGSGTMVQSPNQFCTISGLTPSTAYDFYVQSNCGLGEFSNWSNKITATTAPIPPCAIPTDLVVSTIAANSALATWTAGGSESSWEVECKLDSSTSWSSATVFTASFSLIGLQSNSNYEVRVKAICASNESAFTTPVIFTTLGVGIEENELAQLVELYPNPTHSFIDLKFKSDQLQVKDCKIYDMYGKLIRVLTIHSESTSIDVTDFASGVYFIRMDSERGTISKKFVKK